jgi:hypothetical protein
MIKLQLVIKTNGIEEVTDITFEEKEYSNLKNYYNEIKIITSLTAFQHGLHVSFHMNVKMGGPPVFEADFPPREDFMVLLHAARPFILQDEELYFYKIVKMLKRKIKNKNIVEVLDRTKMLYSGKHSQAMIKVTANDIVINSEDFVLSYLNAYEYHRDQEKRSFFDELFKSFPQNIGRYFVVSLMVDKIKAIIDVGKIIGLIMGEIKELNTQ